MKLYRYENHSSWEGAQELVTLIEFEVIRETHSFYYVMDDKRERRVGKRWRKKFAGLTPEMAWKSYQARKTRQVKILRHQLDRAMRAASLPQPPLVN